MPISRLSFQASGRRCVPEKMWNRSFKHQSWMAPASTMACEKWVEQRIMGVAMHTDLKWPRVWQWVKWSGYVQNVYIFNCSNTVVNSSVTKLSFSFMYFKYAKLIVIRISSDHWSLLIRITITDHWSGQAGETLYAKFFNIIFQMSKFLIFLFLTFISATSRSENLSISNMTYITGWSKIILYI